MTAASCAKSRRNDSMSMSARSISTLVPTVPPVVGSKSSSSGSTSVMVVGQISHGSIVLVDCFKGLGNSCLQSS